MFLNPLKAVFLFKNYSLTFEEKLLNIFPNNVHQNVTFFINKKCENIYQKSAYFINYILLWSNNPSSIIDYIICYFSDEQNKYYYCMELILGVAHSLLNLEQTLESSLGKLYGLYCLKLNFNETKIAHLLDLITELFPNLYLPTHDFQDDNIKFDYFKKITEFYSTFFMSFGNRIDFIAKIFKKILEPIKSSYSDLNETKLEFLHEIEEFFITPTLDKMNFNNKDKKDFIIYWDSHGNFKEYLLQHNKNLLYGIS
jgi:hypothetical protein